MTLQFSRPPRSPVSEGDHHPERRTSVHVIVTCANRKSLPIPSHLQLGEVSGSSAIERVRTWIARLADTGSAPNVPAFDLYAGEHWSVARKFKSHERTGEDIRLWACSAGYGLIPAEAQIMPYHATLTPGQADSVPGDAGFLVEMAERMAGASPGVPAEHRGSRSLRSGGRVHVRAVEELSARLRR